MATGTVTVEHLNIRPFSPVRDGYPSPVVLMRGDRVEISGAVYGQNLEGIDIWYRLKDGSFVWSGGIAPDSEIHPIEKRLIFTADDYGVVDSIDHGVTRGIHAGFLKSVACLTNHGAKGEKSLKKIRFLDTLRASHQIEIGVHLTLSSGSPVTGRDQAGLLCRRSSKKPSGLPESDFYEFTDVRNAYTERHMDQAKFREQMLREFRAQINVLLQPADGGPPVQVDHLTTHHNVHLYHEDFYRIFLEIADEFKLPVHKATPVRSVHNLPEWKDNLFLKIKGKVWTFNHGRKLREIYCDPNRMVNSPGFLNSAHFGPLPLLRVYGKSFRRLSQSKQRIALEMINSLRWGAYDSMEFLLHVRDGQIYKKQNEYFDMEVRPAGYAGIDHRSFDARTAELDSLLKAFPAGSALPKGLILGKWYDLGDKEACRVF